MPDPSWQNEALPPKKGTGVLGKVLIGCGAAALCFLLGLAGLFLFVVHKARTALDKGWARLHAEVHALRTDPGARRLYRENPGLAQNYATEDDFVKAAGQWRKDLGELPEKRPDLRDLLSGRRNGMVSLKTRDEGGTSTTAIRLRMDNGSTLVVELEDDKLTDIQVEH
jgi:hypothetical protein